MPAAPDGSLTLCDFLGECAVDLQGGGLRPLRHYLDRYPSHAEAVARDYLALIDGTGGERADADRIGPYEIVRELGTGGQGRVLLAHHRELGRFVALKVLPEQLAASPTRRARFEREVRIAIELDHPFLCRLLAADLDHSPPYAAMEFVPGHTLAQLLSGSASPGPDDGIVRPRTRRQRAALLDYFAQVARAVDAMHRRGVVHRDLKPANLMLTPAGEPRVLDFGIACPVAEIGALTMTDAAIGTLAYMAPEQLLAKGIVDARSDQFALAAILLETLTGERPFGGSDPTARLLAIQAGVPRRLLRCAEPDLRAILQRALGFDPRDRYPTMTALAGDLRRLRDHRPVSARSIGLVGASRRWLLRHPRLTAWLLAITVGAIFAIAGASAARDAFAAAQLREQGAVEAIAMLDPWGADKAASAHRAATRLREVSRTGDLSRPGDVSDVGPTSSTLALMQLRLGDVAAARTELERHPSGGAPALRFACAAAAADDDALAALLASGVPVEHLVDGAADVAGHLYRAGRWPIFDTLLERSLAALTSSGHCDPGLRGPLFDWQVQGRAIRRDYGRMLLEHLREQSTTTSAFGPDSREARDQRAHFLRVALGCVQDTVALESLRALTEATLSDLRRRGAHPAATLPLEALAIDSAIHTATDDVARLEAALAALDRQLAGDDPTRLRLTWYLARAVGRSDRERGFRLLEQVLAAARPPIVQPTEFARMLHDASRLAPDERTAVDLLLEAARLHVALWGTHDARTLDLLLDARLDGDRCPDLAAWLAESVQSAPVQNDGDLRAQVFRRRLLLAQRDDDPQRTVAIVFELWNDETPFDRHVQREARVRLAQHWLVDHPRLAGEALRTAFDESLRRWRPAVRDPERARRLPSRMLAALGVALFWRGCFDDAEVALQRAALAATGRLGQGVGGADGAGAALAAAAELPLTEDWSRALLGDWADVVARFGRHDEELALRRLAATPPTWLQRLAGDVLAYAGSLERLAECLTTTGHYDEAESCLLRRLRLHSATDDWSTPARQQLADLYELTDRPERATELRRDGR